MTIQDILVDGQQYAVSGTGYAPDGTISASGKKVDVAQDTKLAEFLLMGQQANDTVLTETELGWTVNGEPTDAAFITAYYKAFGINDPELTELDRIPFDSDYLYLSKLIQLADGTRVTAIKGAPDVLLALAAIQDPDFDRAYWLDQVLTLAKQGKRVIVVGTVPMSADETEISHELVQERGIKVKMITGDSVKTASAIGRQLGLADDIKALTGKEVDAMSLEELAQQVEQYDIFARTTPQNKLKQADNGVAMGVKGTDVAKDSADMILANDDFSTIKVAIEQGRRLYDNIKKTILFLLPTSFAEGLIVAISILMSQTMPLTPTQLLWINMVSAITIQ